MSFVVKGAVRFLWGFVFSLIPGIFSPLGALPAVVENMNYKVSLSETLPGLDNQVAYQAGPTITVAVQDKFHSTGFTYPLPVYAIHQYFLKDDTLNLLCRTTPMNAGSGPRYSFFQLNLSNAPDSRQFQPLKRYSFSPDNQSLLAVFDGAGQPDPVALIQLGQPPAKLGWIYKGSLNLFQRFLPAMGKDVVLNDPIGWSADAFTIAFVVSAPDGIQDAQGQPVLRDYLACARLDGESFRVLAAPVDLSPYKFRKGSVITDLKCEGDKAVLFFSQSDSSDILKAEIPLPKLPETKSQ